MSHTEQGRTRFITRPPRCRRGAGPVQYRLVALQWGLLQHVCVCVWAQGPGNFCVAGQRAFGRFARSRDRVTYPHSSVTRLGLRHVAWSRRPGSSEARAGLRAGPARFSGGVRASGRVDRGLGRACRAASPAAHRCGRPAFRAGEAVGSKARRKRMSARAGLHRSGASRARSRLRPGATPGRARASRGREGRRRGRGRGAA